MSWKATAYAKEVQAGAHGERITRSEKLVLLVLADFYNDDRGCAWPSISRLAELCLMCKRQVQRCLDSLDFKGLVETSPGGRGPKDTNEYRFPGLLEGKRGAVVLSVADRKSGMVSPLDSDRVTSDTGKGDISASRGDIAVSPEPQVRTTIIEPPEGGAHKAERPASRGSGRNESGNGFFGPLKEYAEQTWETMKGFRPTWTDKDFANLKRLLKLQPDMPLEEFKARWDRFLQDDEEFVAKQGHSLAYFCSHIDAYIWRPCLELPE